MVSVSISVEDEFKARVESFAWVSWSQIAAEEALKRDIFERYIKTSKLSTEEEEFCDKIDWHPVDWLPLKKKFVKELKIAAKEPIGKPLALEELDNLFGIK